MGSLRLVDVIADRVYRGPQPVDGRASSRTPYGPRRAAPSAEFAYGSVHEYNIWTMESMNSGDHEFASAASRRGRGRPRDLNKRKAILEAAGALFLERGIAATTIESVAERAKASK